MCFTPEARGTEYPNSVPAGIELQNDHECEAHAVNQMFDFLTLTVQK